MKILGLAILTMTMPAPGSPVIPQTCPQLAENSGLTWQQASTKESITCYALRADKSLAFGLNIGTIQVDMPLDPKHIGDGRVAGIPAQWIKESGHTSHHAHAELGDGLYLHAFIPTSPTATFQKRLTVLSELHVTDVSR